MRLAAPWGVPDMLLDRSLSPPPGFFPVPRPHKISVGVKRWWDFAATAPRAWKKYGPRTCSRRSSLRSRRFILSPMLIQSGRSQHSSAYEGASKAFKLRRLVPNGARGGECRRCTRARKRASMQPGGCDTCTGEEVVGLCRSREAEKHSPAGLRAGLSREAKKQSIGLSAGWLSFFKTRGGVMSRVSLLNSGSLAE